MINQLKNILGLGPKADFKTLLNEGAKIIDVRTRAEYASGHIKGSINIPLNEIGKGHKTLSANNTIITCCASGMRSAAAKSQLKGMGFKNVHNGGGWMSLNQKIKKMKETILRGWTSWRIIRMILALVFVSSGIFRTDGILIAAGSYLFLQSLFNFGCAGGSCGIN